MSKKRVEEYKKKLESLESSASMRDDWIDRISHYAVPTLYNYKYDQTNNRSNLPADIYDSEMVQASFEFANLFYSYLTNPSSKWVQMVVEDELMEMPGVKDYLEMADKKVSKVLAQSNFYSAIHQAFRSLVMGNCVIYREKDDKEVVRYYSLPLSECYFEYDKKDRVTSMYRKVRRTPLQLIEEFPKTVDKKVREDEKNNKSHALVRCLHIVRPRWHRDVSKRDKLNKAYESVWVDLDNCTILSESGYDKFPYFVGHYIRDPHQPYSYGPGHLCFYDAKSLNQLALSLLRRAAKEADPVVNLPHDGYILPYLQDPGSVNYRTSDDPKDKAEYMMPPPASAAVNETVNDARAKIKRAFFVDLYRSIIDSTKRMTTVEVQQRIADRAPMLGPAIWNLTTDFINYIIEDIVEILLNRNELGELPEALGGSTFTLRYLSPLAKAQQVSEYQSLQAFLQFLSGAAQFNQNVLDVVDWDKYTRVSADTTGVPQGIINEEDQVKRTRDERNKAMAAQRQKEDAIAAAGLAKDATQADKNIAQAQEV